MPHSIETIQSDLLKANVPFAIILPESKGPFPVLYDLHGLLSNKGSYDAKPTSKRFFEKLAFRKYQKVADGTGTAIVKVNGGRSWYVDSPKIENSKYQSHIIDELIPYIENTYPTNEQRGLSGHSMGGMGVFNFLCRFPTLFSVGTTHCASLRFMPGDHKGSFLEDMFDDEQIEKEFPENFLSALVGQNLKLRITVGKNDKERILKENRALHEFLLEKFVPHIYDETLGAHDYAPSGWKGMVWAATLLGDKNGN